MSDSLLQRIVKGRTDLVFDYLAAGHATAADDGGVALVNWCAHYGDVSGIRYLVSQGGTLQSLGENLGLGNAVFHGYPRLVEFLIEQGADVNHVDEATGETPLHAALCKANRPQYDQVLTLLLAAGADPNRATKPNVETEGFMRDVRTKGETPLHRAAAFGSEDAIQMLLDAGARIEARDVSGDTPLSWASWHLRPARILRKLCYGPFRIHPANTSTYDHGVGW